MSCLPSLQKGILFYRRLDRYAVVLIVWRCINSSQKCVAPLPRKHERLANFTSDSRIPHSTLALATSRSSNHVCLHRGKLLTWLFHFLLVVESKFDLGRLQNNHVITAAAVLAPVAPPPVLADAAAAALFTDAALPPMLAEAAAATLLANTAPPPVLALL